VTPFAAAPFNSPPFAAAPDYTREDNNNTIPLTVDDLGIPSEIKLIVPKIPDIKVMHDVPKEIFLRGELPHEIKIVGPIHPIPTEITIRGDIPKSIEVVHNLPERIFLDAKDVPRTILVEPAPNFPSILRMEVVGMPTTLQVTGIPKTIEIIENIPRTIQLVMPENPVVEMRWNGMPVELKPSPDLEKLLTNLVIPPR
jgi:hypothetical protein